MFGKSILYSELSSFETKVECFLHGKIVSPLFLNLNAICHTRTKTSTRGRTVTCDQMFELVEILSELIFFFKTKKKCAFYIKDDHERVGKLVEMEN